MGVSEDDTLIRPGLEVLNGSKEGLEATASGILLATQMSAEDTGNKDVERGRKWKGKDPWA